MSASDPWPGLAWPGLAWSGGWTAGRKSPDLALGMGQVWTFFARHPPTTGAGAGGGQGAGHGTGAGAGEGYSDYPDYSDFPDYSDIRIE